MNWSEPKVYAVKHKNDETRASSRSGGVFTALSDKILEDNDLVYGCILTDDFKAVHVRAEASETRDLMRGSKYIQSRLGDTYKNVKSDLLAGRNVLFSGTSCQVAGLRVFLERTFDNLLCVDIVCHGVPSIKVWEKYLEWQEKKAQARVKSVDFRNKKDFGWNDHVETLIMDDGTQVNSRVFRNLFYGHNILRPSCYECPFKSIMHPGDITIADYWGIEKAAPGFDDNKGVSLVLLNNEKGEQAFKSVLGMLNYKSTRIEDSMQPPLEAPFSKPVEREQFWYDFSNRNFEYIIKKYARVGIFKKVKIKLRAIKRK